MCHLSGFVSSFCQVLFHYFHVLCLTDFLFYVGHFLNTLYLLAISCHGLTHFLLSAQLHFHLIYVIVAFCPKQNSLTMHQTYLGSFVSNVVLIFMPSIFSTCPNDSFLALCLTPFLFLPEFFLALFLPQCPPRRWQLKCWPTVVWHRHRTMFRVSFMCLHFL